MKGHLGMVCRMQMLAGGTLLAIVVLLVTTLSLLWTMPTRAFAEHCDTLCLPCDLSDSSDLCCSCSTSAFAHYLSQAVKQKCAEIQQEEKEQIKNKEVPSLSLKKFLETTRWTIKPAARFTGTSQPKARIYDGDMKPIRAWRQGQRSFKRYGVRYRNGRLVVPISGTYNIYSFLDLYQSCLPGDISNETRRIEHQMARYNILDGEEQVLVSSIYPHELPQNKYFNIYDSYLTATVSLRAGDEIFVKVSNLSLISNPSSNYFGVHMI